MLGGALGSAHRVSPIGCLCFRLSTLETPGGGVSAGVALGSGMQEYRHLLGTCSQHFIKDIQFLFTPSSFTSLSSFFFSLQPFHGLG